MAHSHLNHRGNRGALGADAPRWCSCHRIHAQPVCRVAVWGCSYCYVMKIPPYPRENPSLGDLGSAQNECPVPSWARRAPRFEGRGIFIGSATDPYQYIERQYRLTRLLFEGHTGKQPEKRRDSHAQPPHLGRPGPVAGIRESFCASVSPCLPTTIACGAKLEPHAPAH